MATQSVTLLTPEEYLEFDRASAAPHEYIFGEIVPVLNGSAAHGLIQLNAGSALRTRLSAGGCLVFGLGPRLRLDPKRVYAYPDVMVICGQLEYTDDKRDTVVNPTLAVEVLSPSTSNYDLGRKRQAYFQLSSLAELLLIDQEIILIEHCRRGQNGQWTVNEVKDRNAVLTLDSVGCEVPVSEIYAGLEATKR